MTVSLFSGEDQQRVQGDDGARVDAGHERPGGEGEAGPEAQRAERIFGQEVCVLQLMLLLCLSVLHRCSLPYGSSQPQHFHF